MKARSARPLDISTYVAAMLLCNWFPCVAEIAIWACANTRATPHITHTQWVPSWSVERAVLADLVAVSVLLAPTTLTMVRSSGSLRLVTTLCIPFVALAVAFGFGSWIRVHSGIFAQSPSAAAQVAIAVQVSSPFGYCVLPALLLPILIRTTSTEQRRADVVTGALDRGSRLAIWRRGFLAVFVLAIMHGLGIMPYLAATTERTIKAAVMLAIDLVIAVVWVYCLRANTRESTVMQRTILLLSLLLGRAILNLLDVWHAAFVLGETVRGSALCLVLLEVQASTVAIPLIAVCLICEYCARKTECPYEEGTVRCERCTYDVRGNRSGRCPECGAPLRPTT